MYRQKLTYHCGRNDNRHSCIDTIEYVDLNMAYVYFRQPFPSHQTVRPNERETVLSLSSSDLPLTMLLLLMMTMMLMAVLSADDADDLLYR